MSLLDLYAESAGAEYDRQLRNPGPPPDPGFSITSFLGAGVGGLPSAALESGANVADVLSGFGTAAAASGGSAGGMFHLPTPEEQKQEAQARDRMLKGDAFDVSAGNAMRRKAAEFAPDPLTSHKADQVMHGLVRFGAKAVTDIGLLGGAGAILLGLDEGNTATQALRSEGVDTATAAKVGAVQGAISAAGAVMPLGGKTIAQTIGLVGVGGPGSFMAQEHLSRKILEEAGYLDQASLHNPFDPWGFALSFGIPGVVGGFHVRGEFKRGKAVEAGTVPLPQLRPEELRALKYDDPRLDAYASATAEKYGVPPAILLAIKNAGEKSGPTAVSGKGAQGVMQFMEGTAKEMGLADRTDPLASIDAAARYMKKLADAYGSWDAAVAHYNGGGAQAAIVRGGGKPTAKETIGYLDRVQKYVAQHTAQEAAKSPEAVDAARVATTNEALTRSLPDTPDAVEQVMRAADIVGERGGRAAEQEIAPVHDTELPQFKEWFGDSKVVDEKGKPLVLYHGTPNGGFDEFSPEHAGRNLDTGYMGTGFYFTDKPGTADYYAQSGHQQSQAVVPVYASLKNPFMWGEKTLGVRGLSMRGDALPGDLTGPVEARSGFKFDPKAEYDATNEFGLSHAVRDELIARGHDGVIANVPGGREYVVFKPEQVKSAIGNSGKFDPNSPSLTDPLRPGERSPRDADNALPPHDSVTLAGDEPAKRADSFTLSELKPPEPAKPDPVAEQRRIVDLRKRESVLQSLLECLEGA